MPREVQLEASEQAAAEAPPSFAELFEAHARFAWRVSARLGVAEADLPDVCQEVFVAVHRMLPAFERRSSITTWIYAICVRTASRYRRKAHRRREEAHGTLPERGAASDPLNALELREFRDKLGAVLDDLPSGQRDVFILYELEELTVPEAAAIVGCPVQTAYSRLHAAREAVVNAFRSKGRLR